MFEPDQCQMILGITSTIADMEIRSGREEVLPPLGSTQAACYTLEVSHGVLNSGNMLSRHAFRGFGRFATLCACRSAIPAAPRQPWWATSTPSRARCSSSAFHAICDTARVMVPKPYVSQGLSCDSHFWSQRLGRRQRFLAAASAR